MDAEATVNLFIERVVGGDLAGAGELVADDLEYDNVPVGKNIGRDALISFLGAMMRGVDAIEFETHRQTCTGNVVMNERTDRFHIGDAVVSIAVAGVFEVGADGRIVLWRDYFDLKMFTDQMAAITQRREAADRPVAVAPDEVAAGAVGRDRGERRRHDRTRRPPSRPAHR